MRDEVGEVDKGHRSYAKEFQTYPEGNRTVGSVPVEEVTTKFCILMNTLTAMWGID